MKKTVLEEALADAKQLKAMAIEEAKQSLHEKITPEIEKLLSKQLNEDLGETEEEDENYYAGAGETSNQKNPMNTDTALKGNMMERLKKLGLDETTIAAIKGALSEESQGEEDMEETEEEESAMEEAFDLDEALAEIERLSEGEDYEDSEEDKEEDAKGQAKKDAEEEGESEEGQEEDEENIKENDLDEEYDIDAILAEMDSEGEMDEDYEEEGYEPDELKEKKGFGNPGPEIAKGAEKGKMAHSKAPTKAFSKDHIKVLHQLVDDMAKAYQAGKGAEKGKDINSGKESDVKAAGSKNVSTEHLEEVRLAKQLKSELNEMKLFAAKNMYLNKVLVLPNLTEAHKAKAITAFDKVKSVEGAKATYEVLKSSITPVKRKQTIAESLGFRQKTSDILFENAKTTTINYLPEADVFRKRAGIKD
jgi:hypothetical protein